MKVLSIICLLLMIPYLFAQSKPITITIDANKVIVEKISPYTFGLNQMPGKKFRATDLSNRLLQEGGVTTLRIPGAAAAGAWDYFSTDRDGDLGTIPKMLAYAKKNKSEFSLIFSPRHDPKTAGQVLEAFKKASCRVTHCIIGCETYGGWDKDHMPAAEFVEKFRPIYEALKAVDSDIKVGAPIEAYGSQKWAEVIYTGLGDIIDIIDIHWYPLKYGKHTKNEGKLPPLNDVLCQSLMIERLAHHHRSNLKRFIPNRAENIDIMMGEWDIAGSNGYTLLDSLCNGIAWASVLCEFIRCDIPYAYGYDFQGGGMGIHMATTHQGVNQVSAKYYGFMQVASHLGESMVSCHVENSPTYAANGNMVWYTSIPVEDSYVSAYSGLKNGRSTLILINKHAHQGFAVNIKIKGFRTNTSAKAWTLTAPSLESNNYLWGNEVQVQPPVESKIDNVSNDFTYRLPAKSVVAIEF